MQYARRTRPLSSDSADRPAPDARMFAIPLDDSSAVPLYRQVYESIRDAILSGRLPSAAQLPSTRGLAKNLGVARNTVMLAFEQLAAEGYLQATVGSGTRVATSIPPEILAARTRRKRRASDRIPRVSGQCGALANIRWPSAVACGLFDWEGRPCPIPVHIEIDAERGP